ncbi:LysR family transcriptional regulator (chromosome initiation inhibitor) [Pseudomonas sp. SORGH_AS199]|uniref:LysR family transcriptional regulator ArgP n=1 Tax=Pseudomonas sp. SORGH_AS_0199 TaxID=3041761 RepID=UPI00285F620C|nr:LysR family transcriptional regulator ArgP [Pseudomonas sp. SORGH_AS_0199]MDR6229043.1 LysR family transcriptional regulator (chromosome initiation inhibitor) [Pseudomonas sp. SORGH_AS_0199]
MIDYKLLEALAVVVEEGGFERAARRLGLSQSAVSQRIKLLEARVGQAVLVRETPPQPTAPGLRLLRHIQQVRLLEADLGSEVPGLAEEVPQRLRIALNADSLASWWPAAVGPWLVEQGLLLDLVVEDQDVVLRRMRAGEVAACLCASGQPLAGARVRSLGAMRYRAVASPDFCARWLTGRPIAQALVRAPAIVFGPDDRLQHRYLEQLGVTAPFDYHLCPSAEGFQQMALSGIGWGLLPDIQSAAALASGALVDLAPGHWVDVPLFWHHWRNGGVALQALTRHLEGVGGQWLVRD